MKTSSSAEGPRGRKRQLTPLEELHGPIPPLKVADIVFVRHKKNFTRGLLRHVTESYWDHVALVLFASNLSKGYSTDILIESIQHGMNSSYLRGVEIHRLDKYLNDPEKYDVGIKRVTWLDEEVQNRVRAYMLMNVDSPYYLLVTSKYLFALVSKNFRTYLNHRQRYSCSGLVQKAFYEAVDWVDRSTVNFKGAGYTPIEMQETVSPGDIARSPGCEWLWHKR